MLYYKKLIGVIVKDLPNYLLKLILPAPSYLKICNRYEQCEPDLFGKGYRCNWQWTSDLHAPKYLPFLGKWLMKRALKDHPIKIIDESGQQSIDPDITFIIGHRGTTRLPHLLATLKSIASQQKCSIECIVVEQDHKQLIKGQLPDWVRYIYTPVPTPDYSYNRSWTFNVGFQIARGKVLILHDNDMLIPIDYASEILPIINKGYEVVNLKRFIFYLTEVHTQLLFENQYRLLEQAPESIVQNLEAGGSIAIGRDAFKKIGGMDESFIGWGGEDNEFWERAQTLKVWSWAYLPIVHLWHPAQPEKHKANNSTLNHYQILSGIPAQTRIEKLKNQANRLL